MKQDWTVDGVQYC